MSTDGARTTSRGTNGSAAVLGVGAAACAACCAGPIVGFIAALGLGTAAGFAVFGVLGLLVALGIGGALAIRRRRQRRSSCAAPAVAVPIAAPELRASP